MIYFVRLLILLAVALSCSLSGLAQSDNELPCPKASVFFLNGIDNSPDEARSNLKQLQRDLRNDFYAGDIERKVNGLRFRDIKFRLNYNQTEGRFLGIPFADIDEVNNFDDIGDEYDGGIAGFLEQHENSMFETTIPKVTLHGPRPTDLPYEYLNVDIRHPSYWAMVKTYLEYNSDPGFIDKITQATDLPVVISSDAEDILSHVMAYREEYEARRKVVIVSHSEGNFFANAEWQAIEGLGDEAMKDSIAIVSVGTPDSKVTGGVFSIPEASRYVTFHEDSVINLGAVQFCKLPRHTKL